MPSVKPNVRNSADARDRFLAALGELGSVRKAVIATGESSRTLYLARLSIPGFGDAWAKLVPPVAAWRSKPRQGQKAGWRKRFLRALETTGNVTVAAKRAGVSAKTVYRLKMIDPQFVSDCEFSRRCAMEAIEGVLIEQAIHGVVTVKTYKGVTTRIVDSSPRSALALLDRLNSRTRFQPRLPR